MNHVTPNVADMAGENRVVTGVIRGKVANDSRNI